MRLAWIFPVFLGLSLLAQAENWWNNDWEYRQRVTFASSEFTQDLENFPLSLRLSDAAFLSAHGQPGGIDLRCVDQSGALLSTEIVQWRADSIEVNILIPRLQAGVPGQYIDLYFGNPNAPALPVETVWKEPYRAVLHLARNAENACAGIPAASIEGQVALEENAQFDGQQPGYLRLPSEALSSMGEQLTLLVRFKTESGPETQNLLSGVRGPEGKEWFNFGLKLPNTVHTNATSRGQQSPELNPQGITPGAWHSAAVRYDARNHTRTICIDGIVLQSDSALPGPLEVNEIRVGRGLLHFDPWQFHGEIDEVRVAATARSDGWLLAETACLSDQNPFIAIASPQRRNEPAPPPGPTTLIAPDEGSTIRTRAGTRLTWRPAPGAERYTVEFYGDSDAADPIKTLDAGTATHLDILPEQAGSEPIFWSVSSVSSTGEAKALERRKLTFYAWDQSAAHPPTEALSPVMRPAAQGQYALSGYLRDRIDRVIRRYFLETPESSPAILQVLRDRDRRPVRDPLMPWAGEFAGKYLTGAELTWRLTRDEELKTTIDTFVRDLIACQGEDGYLGPFPKEARLTGSNWDIWGHYHCMLGLLLYYEDTGFQPALETCKRAADLLFETFGPGGPTLTNDGSGGEMNMAVCHSLVLLYKKTGITRYLDLAKYIVHEAWNSEGAGHYLENALAGKPLIEFQRHRWESIHDWQALAELYWLTGDTQYQKAFEHIWYEGLKGDRHNTGGVTAGEGFQGTPYHTGAIETCCTVAWLAFSIDMLRMTGNPRIADEIEWSTLNSALGAIPFSGRVCAYNVPMDGTRVFGVELPWQSPKAGPDLNCCAVNADRPLGMISQWGLMEDSDGLVLNYYGPGELSAALPGGNRITLRQETDYPRDGFVRIRINPESQAEFALKLRIPAWSKNTTVRINGAGQSPASGTYCILKRSWTSGDVVDLNLDFSLRAFSGEQDFSGKMCLFRGPLLLAYDARYNTLDPDALPALDLKTVTIDPQTWGGPIAPWFLATLRDSQGAEYVVCDLSSAGQTGNHYRTWLPARDPLPPSFSQTAWR